MKETIILLDTADVSLRECGRVCCRWTEDYQRTPSCRNGREPYFT